MKWEYCEHCYIDGHCENQDRGHECAMYGKRMKDKCERLQKQLYIAFAGLQYYANEDNYIESHKIVNGKNEWTSEVALDNGFKARRFLKKIEELNNPCQNCTYTDEYCASGDCERT